MITTRPRNPYWLQSNDKNNNKISVRTTYSANTRTIIITRTTVDDDI